MYTPRLDGNHRGAVGAHKRRCKVERVEDEELVAERYKRCAGPAPSARQAGRRYARPPPAYLPSMEQTPPP